MSEVLHGFYLGRTQLSALEAATLEHIPKLLLSTCAALPCTKGSGVSVRAQGLNHEYTDEFSASYTALDTVLIRMLSYYLSKSIILDTIRVFANTGDVPLEHTCRYVD